MEIVAVLVVWGTLSQSHHLRGHGVSRCLSGLGLFLDCDWSDSEVDTSGQLA